MSIEEAQDHKTLKLDDLVKKLPIHEIHLQEETKNQHLNKDLH